MFLRYHQTIVIHLAECMLSNASHVLNYCQAIFIRETPIPIAKRGGIGKLNNPAKRRVMRFKLQKAKRIEVC
jgi:hypothetical protein